MLIPLPVLLFIDDDGQNLQFYQKYLTRLGYQVLTATHGQEALDVYADRLRLGKIDVIVSDVTMPIMDGPTFAQEVRARFPDVVPPIVFLTGSVEDPRLQGEMVFVKPVSPQKLSQIILSQLKPVPTIPPPSGSPPGDSEKLARTVTGWQFFCV